MASLADSRLVRIIKRVLDVIAAFAFAALVAVPIVAVLAGLEVFDSDGGRPVETWLRTHVAEAPAAADSGDSVLQSSPMRAWTPSLVEKLVVDVPWTAILAKW